MVTLQRIGAGLALVLAFALLVGLGQQLSRKIDHFAMARSDSDAWNFAQVEVAYNRFEMAVQDGLIELQAEGRLPAAAQAEILERFNIFYARVDTVAERYGMFARQDSVAEAMRDLQDMRDGLTVRIDDGRFVTVPELRDLLAEISAARPSIRAFALDAMLAAIEDQEVQREEVHASLRTSFLTLSVLILLLLVLGGILVYLWRSLGKKNASERDLTGYLAKVLEVSSDGIIVVDRTLRVADVNRTAERIFGQDRATLLDRDVMAEMSPRHGRAAMANRLHALLEQTDDANSEMRHMPIVARRGDGTLFPAELNVVRVRDQARQQVLVGFVRDLSRERRARRRTRHALAQARSDAAAKQRFLATMSHEMRTPLHSIVVAADMAEKVDGPGASRQYLPKVRAAAQTALQQVEDVLEVARNSVEAGRTAPETFEGRAVAHSVFLQMQPLAAARANRLVFDWTVPAMLHGVPRDLFRVVHNLVSNAIKATEGGTVTIRASQSHTTGHRELVLEVADTGAGLSETEAEHIFADHVSGFRVQASPGTGLGLGIVTRALDNLGGRIFLNSTLGEGSVFKAVIPLSEDESALDAPPVPDEQEVPEARSTSDNGAIRGTTVLLIEDHATNRQLLEGMLVSLGCHVTTADDGVKGLQSAIDTPFDLILTDLNMPGLSGETVARCLRHAGVSGNACIVAATAKATLSEADKDSIAAGGIDAFLFKPFDSARLEAVMAEALAERALFPDDSEAPSDDGDTVNDPDILARAVRDLQDVRAVIPADAQAADAEELGALARKAHHAGGALLVTGHRRLGQALLELERVCDAGDREGLHGMAIVVATEINRFIVQAVDAAPSS